MRWIRSWRPRHQEARRDLEERLYAAITAVREAAGLGREVEGRDA